MNDKGVGSDEEELGATDRIPYASPHETVNSTETSKDQLNSS